VYRRLQRDRGAVREAEDAKAQAVGAHVMAHHGHTTMQPPARINTPPHTQDAEVDDLYMILKSGGNNQQTRGMSFLYLLQRLVMRTQPHLWAKTPSVHEKDEHEMSIRYLCLPPWVTVSKRSRGSSSIERQMGARAMELCGIACDGKPIRRAYDFTRAILRDMLATS
jgi:hypothetical protein